MSSSRTFAFCFPGTTAKKEAPKTPVKKVRRNLFTGAEGEEPAKEQVRQGQPKGGEVRQQSNRRHSVAGA